MDYILPRPQKTEATNESFIIRYNTEIFIDANFENVYEYAKLLSNTIKTETDVNVQIHVTDKKSLLDKEGILLVREYSENPQGYKLDVTNKQVKAIAGTKEGLLNAVQSLRQLIMCQGSCLQGVLIEDYPLIPNRGFYHDATRGRIQTLESYKRLADTLSLFKINQLQLYIEHTFAFKSFSEVWRDDTPITADEILELDSYCKKLNIDLVPSIATFGHLYKVLKTKSFEELCEFEGMTEDEFSFDQRMQHHTLNVADEKSIEFVKEMLEEFLPLFTSKYVNICADETFDLGKGKSKPLAEKIGVNQMYVDMVKNIADFILERGKTPMFWGDIIIGCPEFASKLPKELICLNWGYGDNEREENTICLKEQGMQQYLCPGVHGWRHVINKIEMGYANISLMAGYALKHGAIGLLNTDWGDYGHLQDPEFSIPGMIYGASFAWSGVMPEKEIDEMISRIYYGDKTGKLLENIKNLDRLEAVSWERLVQYKEHEDKKKELEMWYPGKGVEKRINEEIDQAVNVLYSLNHDVNSTGKRMIRKLAIFAEGQKLIHTIFEELAKISDNTSDKEDRFKLASEIEAWMYEYKKVWRESSKESELYRNEEVFYWYSDMLRRVK